MEGETVLKEYYASTHLEECGGSCEYISFSNSLLYSLQFTCDIKCRYPYKWSWETERARIIMWINQRTCLWHTHTYTVHEWLAQEKFIPLLVLFLKSSVFCSWKWVWLLEIFQLFRSHNQPWCKIIHFQYPYTAKYLQVFRFVGLANFQLFTNCISTKKKFDTWTTVFMLWLQERWWTTSGGYAAYCKEHSI